MALVPVRAAGAGGPDWLRASGKTQLAIAAADALRRARSVDQVVWITATSRRSVLSGYAAAAATAMGAEVTDSAESVAARFVSWLGQTDRPWLVVLDDLSGAADMDGLWPGRRAGRILVTTCDPESLPGDAEVLPVGPFSPREALTYLMGSLNADPDQRFGAVDLVGALTCEPLALVQASAVIASSSLSCRDYWDYFVRRREHMTEAPSGPPPAAAVTWTFSFEQADHLVPDGSAQSLLALTALLDGHGIPGPVLTSAAACEYLAGDSGGPAIDPDRAAGALGALKQAGLLAIDAAVTPPMVRMSPVLQAVLQAAIPGKLRQQAARSAADALLEAWLPGESPAWLAESFRACTASLQQTAGDLLWADGCHPVLIRAGQSRDSARLTDPAVAYWRELTTTSDRLLGAGHPDTLAAGRLLADAYLAAGRAADAVPWFEWLRDSKIHMLGSDHREVIEACCLLGHSLVAAGQCQQAISVLRRAVEDSERIAVNDPGHGFGREHPDALTARASLASAYRAADRTEDAIGEYERVLAGQGRVLGQDHPDTLATLGMLAFAYRTAGRTRRAISAYERGLAGRERTQGNDHPDTLTARANLASAYHTARRPKDAIREYERTLADRERLQGRSHPETLTARANLASAYHSARRVADAIPLYERIVADFERVMGPDHPDTLISLSNLAHAYHTAGRLAESVTLFQRALGDCERALGPDHPLTTAMRENAEAATQA